MATTPIFLPGKYHEKRSLVVYSLWSSKELDMTEHTKNVYIAIVLGGNGVFPLKNCRFLSLWKLGSLLAIMKSDTQLSLA